MTPLQPIYSEYMLKVRSHTPAISLSATDYFTLFKSGVRRMFVDTGRKDLYFPAAITSPESSLSVDIGVDEEEYIVIAAQIAFYEQMLADVTAPNRITQHKTDALTVTFNNKDAEQIASTLRGLEMRLNEQFHKMPQFAEARA